MAEVVECNIENSLGEIVHIRKAKLFNEAEIREIVRHRRQHEYSIQKRNKCISDYDSYIATELGILRLVSLRRIKMMDYRFKDEIEKSILSRLVRLHRQSCYRFQGHLDVWIRFLFFNRKLGRHMAVVRLWERILQVHGRTDPRLWAAAAAFHLNEGCRAQARSCLSKLKNERQALKLASKKLRRLGKNPTCHQEQTLLRMETYHFKKLRQSLNRSVQLTWDHSHLRGIREARRLLTQGLSFNEDSVDLLLELLKLEGIAADFFAKRVSKRLAKAQELDMEYEVMKSGDNHIGKSKRAQRLEREREMKVKEERENAANFINEVTEDVDFVMSGGTFKLVLERFLTFSKVTSKHLAAAVEIAQKFSRFADMDILAKLRTKQQELHEAEAAGAIRRQELNSNENLGPISLLEEATKVVDIHYRGFQDLLDQAAETENDCDIDTALATWKEWYQPANKPSDLLQIFDPSIDPRWMKLLTLRIYVLVVAKTIAKVKIDKAETKDEMLKLYQDFKLKQAARVQDTRGLMDLLAASSWGSKVANFWHLYLEFEEKLGDCSRLPSLRWRAEKCLNEGPRTKFLADLSTINGQKMEFL
nr:u3 small nucleolar rna associated protein 6 [Hymenolepis microstoma]